VRQAAGAAGRAPGRWTLVAIVIAVGIGWGSSHATGKMATETGHGAFGIMFWQLAICTLLLGGVSLWRGKGLVFTPAAWRFYVVVALMGTIIPNYTFYTSVVHLPAGLMSIIIALIPMLSLPMAVAVGIDRFSAGRLAGLGLGLAGVAMIAAPGGGGLPQGVSLGWLAVALIGPLFYAMEATFVARQGTAGMDAVQAMFGASLVGMLICLPILAVTGQGFRARLAVRAGGLGAGGDVGQPCGAIRHLCLAGDDGGGGLCRPDQLYRDRIGRSLGDAALGRTVFAGGVGGACGDAGRCGIGAAATKTGGRGRMFGLTIPAEAMPWVALAILGGDVRAVRGGGHAGRGDRHRRGGGDDAGGHPAAEGCNGRCCRTTRPGPSR
jgi:drug/metabolite transporter (DMT)-like permease